MKTAIKINKTELLIFSVIFLTLLAAYSPLLNWFFARDDFGFLPHLPTTLANLPAILTPPRYWFFRPLSQQFYFWINSLIWGLNPLDFRLVGVLMLSLNTTLVYKLLRRFSNNYASLFGAVFYGLNTIHLFEIGWIAANYQTMSTLLFLTTLLLATSARRKHKLLSYVTLILAFFCSEMSIFILPTILLYEFVFQHTGKLVHWYTVTFFVIRRNWPYLLLTAIYFAFYFWYVKLPGGNIYGRYFDPISVIKTLGKYILYPFVAGFDRAGLLSLVNVLLATKVVIILTTTITAIKNKALSKNIIFFGFGLFLITVSIFTLLGNHTFAYLDAIPTIGIAILVAATFKSLTASPRLSKIFLASFFILSISTLILAQKTDPDLKWLNEHQMASKKFIAEFRVPKNKTVVLDKSNTDLMEATYFGQAILSFYKNDWFQLSLK